MYTVTLLTRLWKGRTTVAINNSEEEASKAQITPRRARAFLLPGKHRK